MKATTTDIDGVLILEPTLFEDSRGYFFESFNATTFRELTGIDTTFVQDNESMSSYGVLRGLHFQKPPYAQSKLVRCVKGNVLDVAVDIRKGSPTYGKWVWCELSEDNHKQFFVPKGFAHGFCVISDIAVFQYKCDEFWNKEAEGALRWDDPDIDVKWPVEDEDIILSDKDKNNVLLKDFDSPFDYNVDYYKRIDRLEF